MFDDILFVSYLKNKGVRRICFVLGLILALFVLLIQWSLGYEMNKIYKFLPIVFFYIPFFIAVIFKWIYVGFKDTKDSKEEEFLKVLNGIDTVYNPTIEADVKLNDSDDIYHCLARNYDENGDNVFVVVLFKSDRTFSGVTKINVTKNPDAYDNFLSIMIPGTIYIKGKKVEEEENSSNESEN